MEITLKKIDLSFDEENHIHTLNGVMVPGATTITDLFPKKALVPWAAKLTSEAVRSEWEPGRPYPKSEIERICKDAKSAWRNASKLAADRGTKVHKWIEEYAKTGLFPHMPDDEKCVNAINLFLRWKNENQVEFAASEIQCGSEEHMFACIIDILAVVNGRLSLVEVKTSNDIYESFYVQTAGQKICLDEMECPPFDDRIILWIPKTGDDFKALLVPTPYNQDKATFLAALNFLKQIRWYDNNGFSYESRKGWKK